MAETVCKNCESPLRPEDRFCPQCGQAAKTKRLKIRQIRKEALKRTLHADSGILYLTKALALRPGIVAREYFAGKRKKYYEPLKYLSLTVGISALVTAYFDLMSDGSGHQNPVSAFVAKHVNIIFFLSVPLAAAYSRLLFRKKGFNYAEHLTLHAFLGGFRTVFFLLIFTPLIVLFREHYNAILLLYFAIWGAYVAWANTQLMGKPYWLSILNTVLILVLTQATISVLIFAVAWGYFRQQNG